MSLTALDDVLRGAASVRVEEIEWYGEVVVDLSQPHDRDRLRAAMRIGSLPGYVCACTGQVRFVFFDARGEPLTRVVAHHGVSLAWQWESGHGELADGAELLRWLAEHGLPGPGLSWRERPERLAWIAAMPPALEEMADDLVGHWPMAHDSKHVIEARKRLQGLDPVTRVQQLLTWLAAGIGKPPYEDVPGLILRETPIAEIIAALEDPRADERHDKAAARLLLVGNSRIKQRMDVARLPGPLRVRIREAGYEVPQWAERLLLNA